MKLNLDIESKFTNRIVSNRNGFLKTFGQALEEPEFMGEARDSL